MNINYKEAQFEFFPQGGGSSRDAERPRALAAQMTLSIENLVILMIVSIMVMLLAFSMGVERGKKVSASAQPAATVESRPIELPSMGRDLAVVAPSRESAGQSTFFSRFWPSGFGPTGQAELAADNAASGIKSAGAWPEPTVENKAAVDVKVPKIVRKEPVSKVSVQSQVAVAGKRAPKGVFTVQVASYKTEKTAGREAQNLKQKGYRDVYVIPKGSYVIVCVGNFSSKADASAYTRKLKGRYQEPVVRRL